MEGRLDDELAIFDHDIFFRGGRLFEFAVSRSTCQQARMKVLRHGDRNAPKASEIHFLGPDIGIEAPAPILIKYKFVGMIDNRAEATVDEIPSDAKAQSKSDQRNDGDPFLSWVLDCLPRMVDLPLLHAARTEVFLVLLLVVDVNG